MGGEAGVGGGGGGDQLRNLDFVIYSLDFDNRFWFSEVRWGGGVIFKLLPMGMCMLSNFMCKLIPHAMVKYYIVQ